jgi:hypothetical protein
MTTFKLDLDQLEVKTKELQQFNNVLKAEIAFHKSIGDTLANDIKKCKSDAKMIAIISIVFGFSLAMTSKFMW